MSMPVVPLELDGVIAHERRGFSMDGVVVDEFERIVGFDDSRRRMTTLGAGTTAAQIAVCVSPLVSVPPSDGHSPLDSFDQARKHTHENPSPAPLSPQAVPWRLDRSRPRQGRQRIPYRPPVWPPETWDAKPSPTGPTRSASCEPRRRHHRNPLPAAVCSDKQPTPRSDGADKSIKGPGKLCGDTGDEKRPR